MSKNPRVSFGDNGGFSKTIFRLAISSLVAFFLPRSSLAGILETLFYT